MQRAETGSTKLSCSTVHTRSSAGVKRTFCRSADDNWVAVRNLQSRIKTVQIKMAAIIRVIYVTVIIVCYEHVLGQSLSLGKCPSYPAIKKLDLKKFEGNWYEVERSFYFMEMFASCTALSFTEKPSGILKVTVKNINRLTGNPSVGLGTAVPIKNGSGELNYRVDTKLPSALARMMPGSGVYHVLDTDYDNYAILWSCSNLSFIYADLIWVLGRDRELPVSVRAMVYDKLSELKLDTDRLVLTRQKNCPAF